MAFTFRGAASAGFSPTGTSAGTVSGTTTGDVLVGFATSNSGAFTALGNGWVTVSLKQDGNTATFEYLAYKIATGSNDSFSPAFAGGGQTIDLIIGVWSGTTVTNDGASATSNANVTSYVGGSLTPTANNDLNVLVGSDTSGSGATPSTPGTFASAVTGGASMSGSGFFFYKVLSGQSGVAQNQAVTMSAASYGPMANLLFKEAGGGGGGGAISVAGMMF